MVLASLWQFLFTPGYYYYSDVAWPLVPSLPNSESFALLAYTNGRIDVVNLFQFTRDIVSFPSLVTSNLGLSYPDSIKLFVAVTFFLAIVALWAAAEVVVRLLESRFGTRLSPVAREGTKLFFVLAAYGNAYILQVATDGGQLTGMLILPGIAVSIILLATHPGKWTGPIIGALLAIGALLNPDYYLIAVLGLGAVAVFAAVYARTFLRGPLPEFLKAVVYSLPILLLMVWGLHVTATPAGLHSSYRPITQAVGESRNLWPWTVAGLVGIPWAYVPMGPPSILVASGSLSTLAAVGKPAYLLLPPGALTYAWLAALGALPVACFLGLGLRRFRSVTVPVCAGALASIVLTLYARIPPLVPLAQAASNLPYVGFEIGTSLSIPSHALLLVAAVYVAGGTVTIFALLSRPPGAPEQLPPSAVAADSGPASLRPALPDSRARFLRRHRATLRRATVCALIALLVFSGWQAYSGSYYPARADYSTFEGNGVPTGVGAFTPFAVPSDTLAAYDFLFDNGTNFNVFWPVGYGVGAPTVEVAGLPYLLSSGLLADVSAYLESHGIRYVVVQKPSAPVPAYYVPNRKAQTNPYAYYFGLPNYSSVVANLSAAPGLSEVFSRSGLEIFQVTGVDSLEYPASLLLSANSEAGLNATVYGALAASGINATLTPAGVGVPFSFGVGASTTTSLVTPANLTGPYLNTTSFPQVPLNTTVAQVNASTVYTVNSTGIPVNATWTQSHSAGQDNVFLDGFGFTNWGGNFTVTVSDGSISIYGAGDFTLNFGGPASKLGGKGVALASGLGPLYSSLSASFSVSDPSTASIAASFVGVNATGSHFGASQTYPVDSSQPVSVSTSYAIPAGTALFTYRLGGTFQGYLNISLYNLSLQQDPIVPDSALPFGTYLSLGNSLLELPGMNGTAIALVNGSGTLNGVRVDSSAFTPVSIPMTGELSATGSVDFASLFFIRGGSITSVLGHYVVYNGAFSDSVLVVYGGSTTISPIASTYRTNLYVLPGNGTYRIELSPTVQEFEIAYVAGIAYLAGLVALGWALRAGRFPPKVYRRFTARVRRALQRAPPRPGAT